jgi:hypothetical protein
MTIISRAAGWRRSVSTCEFINRNGVTNLWARRGKPPGAPVLSSPATPTSSRPVRSTSWQSSPPFAPEIA